MSREQAVFLVFTLKDVEGFALKQKRSHEHTRRRYSLTSPDANETAIIESTISLRSLISNVGQFNFSRICNSINGIASGGSFVSISCILENSAEATLAK